jgi:hypothetical protein
VGGGGSEGEDLGVPRPHGLDLHRRVLEGRPELQRRLAAEPGRGRDGERGLRHNGSRAE